MYVVSSLSVYTQAKIQHHKRDLIPLLLCRSCFLFSLKCDGCRRDFWRSLLNDALAFEIRFFLYFSVIFCHLKRLDYQGGWISVNCYTRFLEATVSVTKCWKAEQFCEGTQAWVVNTSHAVLLQVSIIYRVKSPDKDFLFSADRGWAGLLACISHSSLHPRLWIVSIDSQ